MWDVDFMHPIDPGMAAIADLVAYLFQQTALSLLLSPLSAADRTLLQEQLPLPMFTGERGRISGVFGGMGRYRLALAGGSWQC